MTVEQKTKEEQQKFVEVIIDVGIPDDWARLNLLRFNLSEVPSLTTILKAEDDRYIQIPKTPEGWPEQEIEIVFKPHWMNAGGQPRAIFLADGRVFVREGILEDEAYLKTMIPPAVKVAKNFFEKRQN